MRDVVVSQREEVYQQGADGSDHARKLHVRGLRLIPRPLQLNEQPREQREERAAASRHAPVRLVRRRPRRGLDGVARAGIHEVHNLGQHARDVDGGRLPRIVAVHRHATRLYLRLHVATPPLLAQRQRLHRPVFAEPGDRLQRRQLPTAPHVPRTSLPGSALWNPPPCQCLLRRTASWGRSSARCGGGARRAEGPRRRTAWKWRRRARRYRPPRPGTGCARERPPIAEQIRYCLFILV